MRLPQLALCALLAGVASSQSPLVVSPPGGAYYAWVPGTTSPQVFFDLTVNAQVTLTSLRSLVWTPPLVGILPADAEVSLWLTNPGLGTFVGSETTPSNWHEAAKWPVTMASLGGTTPPLTLDTCVLGAGGAPLTLAPGAYGCAIRFTSVQAVVSAVPSVPNTFATAELSLTGGAAQDDAFVSAPQLPAAGFAGWSWIGEIHYVNGAAANNCATATSFGIGCNATGAPLLLTPSAAPRRGTTITMTTSNEPTNGVGISFVGTLGFANGVDMAFLGAPGCTVYEDPGTGVGIAISNLGLPGLGMSYSLPIPNVPLLLGVRVYAQSVWLDPAANPFGVVTSNGLELVID